MEKLFVYGSLQPGGPNEHVLTALGGAWEPAVIRGRLVEDGWGAALGYPGLVVDDEGAEIAGQVLASASLAAYWAELDAFEGDGYERVLATVTLRSGEKVGAHVYVLRR